MLYMLYNIQYTIYNILMLYCTISNLNLFQTLITAIFWWVWRNAQWLPPFPKTAIREVIKRQSSSSMLFSNLLWHIKTRDRFLKSLEKVCVRVHQDVHFINISWLFTIYIFNKAPKFQKWISWWELNYCVIEEENMINQLTQQCNK